MEWLLSKALMLGGVIAAVAAILWRAFVAGQKQGREAEKKAVDQARSKLQERYDEIDAETPDVDRAYDDLRRMHDKN